MVYYGSMPTALENREPTRLAQPLPLYNVIVHNCNCHTFDDVIVAFVRIINMNPVEASQKAFEIDYHGRAIVATVHEELAELYADRLKTETVNQRGTALRVSVVPAR